MHRATYRQWRMQNLKGCSLWWGTYAGAVYEELWEGFMLEKLVENRLLWQGPHAGAGHGLLYPSSSRNNLRWTHHNPIPPISLHHWVEGCRARKEGGGKVFLRFVLLLLILLWFWLAINYFSQIKSVLSLTVFDEHLSSSFVPIHKPFAVFSLPIPVR